jgi:DNA modification methylase
LRDYGVEGQIGLEKTPEEYVQHIVEVSREIWRVLRKDGTYWLNLGDCYATGGGKVGKCPGGGAQGENWNGPTTQPNRLPIQGLKAKDLVGIPWRVAFALQADGWYLRAEVIWNKRNPMPESVRDRPTRSHEQIFLLTKSGNISYSFHMRGNRNAPNPDYRWVDELLGLEYEIRPLEFTKEKIPCPDCGGEGMAASWFGEIACERCEGSGKIKRWKKINLWQSRDYFYDQDAIRENHPTPPEERYRPHATGFKGGDLEHTAMRNPVPFQERFHPNGRNKRSVWEIATQPYSEAHFATFPEELPEICIKAGTSLKGCCPKCGASWERVVEIIGNEISSAMKIAGCNSNGGYYGESIKEYSSSKAQNPGETKKRILESMSRIKSSSWAPTCDCGESETVPCVVLDPFAGSGTTGAVARRLGRSSVLIELNPEYVQLIKDRTDYAHKPLDSFPQEVAAK